jgi:chromosome segregation ATPase
MMTELEEMADILADKKKQIITLLREKQELQDKYSRLSKNYEEVRGENTKLKKQVESPYNTDTIRALMDAHELIRAENKELHKRADAAFAGVAMDASAKKHYLQAIIERLDGIKSSVEAALKE